VKAAKEANRLAAEAALAAAGVAVGDSSSSASAMEVAAAAAATTEEEGGGRDGSRKRRYCTVLFYSILYSTMLPLWMYTVHVPNALCCASLLGFSINFAGLCI
jgi:hypothetical protein